jgi:hypothetical protein
MRSDIDVEEFCKILSGSTATSPVQSRRCHPGFVFGPVRGSSLGLPASQSPALEHAVRAQITVRGMSAIAFALDVRLQDASGDWSEPAVILYVPHRDPGHAAPLRDIESYRLPPNALLIDIAALDDDGTVLARKQGTLPVEMLRSINGRVERAQAQSYRQTLVDQAIAILKLRREGSSHHGTCECVLELRDPE